MGNLVSIIVPCYNGEEFVDRCFASNLRQDYFPLEVIAVNDGSTDSSAKIISVYERFYEQFSFAFYVTLIITQHHIERNLQNGF